MSKLPSLTGAKAIAAFERAGFAVAREGAKHTLLTKKDHPFILAVPRHKGDLSKGTLVELVRASGLSRDEFLTLLG